ncbi:MAG TPA: DUF5660 family protein [Patescibacteria group bacterium]|nr:DUF5660 family protein [Patescibacteria group bacterium]
MADNKKSKGGAAKRNIIESLKDISGDFTDQSTDLLKTTSEDFFRELMGIGTPVKRSGEMKAGESVEMAQVLSGKEEENEKLRAQIALERNLSADESRLSQEKMQELRIQLQAITVEIGKLAASTGNLATQTEIAMVEVPVNPGVYHVIFFEKVLEFLMSFRKKIDQASIWLGGTNKRAEKKNYWSMYKKKGSSFLLSPDHYLQRSAG